MVEVLAPHGARDSGCGGLESKFGWGPGHLGQESDGLVLLMPGVQAGVCFGVPSWATLVHESPCNTVKLVYDLAPYCLKIE